MPHDNNNKTMSRIERNLGNKQKHDHDNRISLEDVRTIPLTTRTSSCLKTKFVRPQLCCCCALLSLVNAFIIANKH